MAFVPENDLEEQLVRATSEASARPEFYSLLLDSKLYVIGGPKSARQEREFVAQVGDKMNIASIAYKDKSYIPVFTSLARLNAFISEPHDYYALKGRDLFELTRGACFILNAGADYGKELLPAEIERLLNPSTPDTITIQKPTQVLLGEPAIYPQALVDALKTMLAQRSDVLNAYLLQIAFPDTDEPSHPLIGVEATGDWQSLSKEIGRISSIINPGCIIDVVPIDRSKQDDTLVNALLRVPPFYRRSLPTV